ncbi:MAG: translocation/assembly module TamB domain-containing protein [Gemmatimonadaceae bacterium]
MRAILRLLRWMGIGLATLLVACVALLLVAFYTAAGRDRVRDVVARLASGHINGTLHLGRLRFTPGCAIAVDSLAMRDADDSLLVATGPVGARCDVAALVRGRLVLHEVTLTRPLLSLRELPGGGLNWAHAFRRDTTPGPSAPRTSPAVVVDDLRVRDGVVLLATLVKPAPARANSAAGRRIAGGGMPRARDSVARSRWSGLQLGIADLRAAAPDADLVLRLTRLAARGDRPPLAVRDARGTLRVAHDSAWFTLPRLAFGRSAVRASGALALGTGATRFDVRVDADTVAFADLAWADSIIPTEGGGRARLRLRTGARPDETEYVVSGLDASTSGSRVRGGLALRVARGAADVGDVALDLAPLRLDLVRRLYGRPLPYDVRGDVEGRVVARGGTRRDFRLDTVRLRFRDERVRGAVSQLSLSGAVDLSEPSRLRFRGLRVSSDGIDARSAVLLFPGLPRFAGRLAFAATLDSALDDVRVSDARLDYREGGAPPLSLRAAGRVAVRGGVPVVDGAVRFEPLSFAALARAAPALRGWPDLRGEVVARGTLDDLSLRAALAGAGGSVAWDGRLDARTPTLGARGRASVRRLDLRVATGDTALPRSDLSLDLGVELHGASARTLAGSAELRVNQGRVAGIRTLPSLARLRLAPDRVIVDSAALRTTVAELRASGALGRTPGRRDTLGLALTTDSLGRLVELVQGWSSAASSADAAPRRAAPDSVRRARDSATAAVRLVGSTDTLAASGTASVDSLAVAALAVARGRVDFDLAGLPAAPRGRVSLALDSARASTLAFGRLVAEARAERAGLWRLAARSGGSDVPGFAAAGSVALSGATRVVTLDSLDYHDRENGLRLARAASVRLDSTGTVADTLELVGRRGSRFRFAGAMRRDSTLDAFLSAERVPLAALTRLGGQSDTTAPGGPLSTVTADALLTGTRAAPVATFHGLLRSPPRDSSLRDASLLDSVRVGGAYRSDRAIVALGAYGIGRTLVEANAVVPVRVTLSPASATMLDAPLTGRLVVDSVALRDVRASFPAFPATAGTALARVELGGSGRRPKFRGELRVRDGALDPEALGFRLDDLQMDVGLLGDSLQIRQFSVRGKSDVEGTATLGGWIAVREPSNPTFDLRLSAAHMPVVALQRRAELELESDLRLTGAYDGATLGGRIVVSRGVLRLPELSGHDVVGNEDSAFVRLVDSLTTRGRGGARGPGVTRRFVDHLMVRDLELRMGNDVWLRSAEANLNIGGAVRVTKSAAHEARDSAAIKLGGELRLVRGTYSMDLGAFRRTFELENGTLRFEGENAINPAFDINALHVLGPDPSQGRVQEVRIRAHIGGTLQSPTLVLSNAGGAEMSQEELLSYLVTGQPTFEVGEGSAYRELARSELSSRVASNLANRLNGGGLFDMVTITPGAVTEDDATGVGAQTVEALKRSRLGVGKKLNDRTFLTVDAGGCALTGSSSQTSLAESLGLSLDYRLSADRVLSVRSEPPTTATICGGSLPHGFALAPRQWGIEALRRWRF